MDFQLCSYCLERHNTNPYAKPAPSPTACFICQGSLSILPQLAQMAAEASAKLEWETFGVQANLPRDILLREEKLFDFENIENSMAIKNQSNRLAIDCLQKITGKMFSQNAELQFVLDFSNQIGRAVPANIYIFGHYNKKTRDFCQHDWACSACRGKGCKKCNFHAQNYPSIESAIREVFAPAFGASDSNLHASGREDVDVMCLGNGRPFVLELIHPAKRKADLDALAQKLASKFPLEVQGLQYCSRLWIESVCNSHFEKHYRAWVGGEKEFSEEDAKKLESAAPLGLLQNTPTRVLGRRSDLLRPRKIYEIKEVSFSPKEIVLDIWAEAGTYIKEFVHSDSGRTKPSISSILGVQCSCRQLDVMGIDDIFTKTLRA